jgi:hypothetical protein
VLYYDAARALLDQIAICMGGERCEYALFVSMGTPPAVCSSIAAHFGGATSNRDSSECLLVTDDVLHVTITRCCVESEVFDPVREDLNAKCFLDDLWRLKNCIACEASAVLDPYTEGCSPVFESVRVDVEIEGGCYSATITLSFTEVNCCPPLTPPPVP